MKNDPNIGIVHTECADSRLERYQAEGKHEYAVGDFIKTGMENAMGKTEHGWVEITELGENYIIGKINSAIVYPTNTIHEGAILTVPHRLISQHIEGD